MANFLVVHMVAAAMVMSSWPGGGEFLVAAQESSRVVFIDDFPMPEVISKEPPSCLSHNTVGADLCTEDPEYNETIKLRVKTLLSRDRGINNLLNDPSLRTILDDVMVPKLDPGIVDTRFGGETETPVCAAQETLIYPQRGKTQNNEWVFVVNQENVQQAIRVEKCISDGSSCGLLLPKDIKATCRQKYIYRRLLVLGTNKILPEEVLIPSCCVCYTTYQGLTTRSKNGTNVASLAHVTDPQPVASHSGVSDPQASGPAPSSTMNFFSRRGMRRLDHRPIRYLRSFQP